MRYVTILLIALAVPCLAEQFAVTDDGQAVLLNDDGTWKYTDEDATGQEAEKERFWTGIGVNVAKILGILSALLVVRFLIQSIMKSRKKDPPRDEDS